MPKPHGVLLLNVGTPAEPSYWSVKKYLDQFLMDKRIIDIPYVLRFLLVRLLITPLRAKESAQKYREIWQKDGSPLYAISVQQTKLLQEMLGPTFAVAFAMRYGEPSIKSTLNRLLDEGCEQIILMPLFPQYSSAASGSALEEALRYLTTRHHIPAIKTVLPFYSDDFYIDYYAKKIAGALSPQKHLILSFHGLPQHHIDRNHFGNPCTKNQSCPSHEASPFCYRGQSFRTAARIAEKLRLTQDQYSVCFQSRLGRRAWIEPYLNDTLKLLRNRGVEDLVVACPSFVSDCLETVHEIGIEARATWSALQGKSLELIPCPNADIAWLNGLSQKIDAMAKH